MSTPHSDHISSTSPYSTSAKIDAIDPFIEKDVTHFVTANGSDMCNSFFRSVPNDSKLDSADIEACLDPRRRESLTEYNNYVDNADMPKNTSYHSFCELVNHILHEIANDIPNIPFWHFKDRNVNRRVPDVLCVSDGQWKKIKNGPPHSFKPHDKPDYDAGDESLDPPQPAPELTVPSAPFSISHSTSEWAGAWIQVHDRKAGNLKRKPPCKYKSGNDKRPRLKSRKADIGPDIVEQHRRYAAELMSMVETGTHDTSALVSGFHNWMYYYLNTASMEDRGLWNKGTRCNFEAGRIFNLSASLYWKLSRGTRAYRAQEGRVARDFAIKYARSARKRRLEPVGRYVRELAEDANFRAQHNVGDSNTYHLSSVFFSEDNQELKYSFWELVPKSEYENRVRRCFRKSFPDPQIGKHQDFVKAFRDIFQVLHLSWRINFAHCDISVGNLMFHRGANGQFFCGVLNELNLTKVDEVLSEFLFRTGTRGFLATDLLKSVSKFHIERFDWESALFVLIWITTRYENGEEKYTDALKQWLDLKDTNASNAKFTYIDHFEKRPGLKTFKLLDLHWIDPWTVLFHNGFQARSNNARAMRRELTPASESFDNETLGGHVTYEKIWDILGQDLAEDGS